ncbi:Hydroxypyruvate isomerase [Roseimaritima multifibrata]|uniref:Hydroxypyruvate isomerase n=1 Tax=Roseimaritima multifibrata TaxID=1930274 RepID=A0A517MD33_9BACT|nr:TIM barrel protein [Roseimaritima multifibrata]QDS92791.1 Hydroxypyruvate isomerase [Roseimaritima multifibrata]
MQVDATQGRLKQSVCQWCYGDLPLDQLATEVAQRGMAGIDLLGPDDFQTVKDHGLICTMITSHPLEEGLCDPQFHDMCLQSLTTSIEAAAAEGWPNVICFTGNARGIDRETGMQNCITALDKILPLAQAKGVTLVMELLNSRVDHPDYMCDQSAWGVELFRRLGSKNFGLLFDLYHMQIMEGDLIRTIGDHHEAFAHYHTAGNPGRHELDDQQELYYPAIARAIAGTGFQGYLAHEFMPKRDPLAALSDAVRQCIV